MSECGALAPAFRNTQTASKATVRMLNFPSRCSKGGGMRVTVAFVLPLPRGWETTAAFRSWGSAAGRRSLGLWVCGAVCTCCQAPPPL